MNELATGPRTAEGKARSSQNALQFGLFATRISPDRERDYEAHGRALLACLTPANPIEDACAREIIRATWRLNRCAEVEETNEDGDVQKSVDRARAQALNAFLKSTAELRRLQTNRRIAIELYPDGADLTKQGIAAQREIFSAVSIDTRRRVLADKLNQSEAGAERKALDSAVEAIVAEATADSLFCNPAEAAENTEPEPTHSEPAQPQIPRSAPCPCQSGEKYKRCCGRNAPPVLCQPSKVA